MLQCPFACRPLCLCLSVGETVASCHRGRLLQGRFMQNDHIDGEIADSSPILSTKGNTDERKQSMHANYSRYGQKSLFIPLQLLYASSQLFF